MPWPVETLKSWQDLDRIVGWALEELGIRPLLPRADRAIVTLLFTFGVSLIFRDIAQVIWGTETRSVAAPLTGIANLAQVFIPIYRIFVFGACVLAIAVLAWACIAAITSA